MKKGLVAAAVLLLAAGGAAAGWYYYNDQSWNLEYFQNLFNEEKKSVYVTDIATLMGLSSTVADRYAGVVEPQSTVSVQLESNRRVKEVKVKEGDMVTQGQLLFEYDLSSIEQNLQTAQLDMERLQNEAINYQNSIANLEKEKKKAKASEQLSYTIEIETNKMSLKKNEYDQKSKQAEIERLTNATTNTEVRSEIDGIIQKIDTSKISTGEDDDTISSTLEESYGGYDDGSGSNNAFITILSTGAYRVKGKVNELNRDQIIPGNPVIIRSRVDENVTWRGTMGYIDTQSDNSNNTDSMWGGGTDEQTASTTYPFYVELNSSEGLMLGQHVYIETDIGQDSQREGLWLLEDYIVDADTEEPFVWMAGSGNKLIRQKITVGEYDPYQMQYEILDGVTEDDYIAFPSDQLEEGMITVIGSIDQTRNSMLYMEEDTDDGSGEEGSGEGEYIDEYDDSLLKEDGGSEYYDPELEVMDDGDYEYQDIQEIDGEMLDGESILDGDFTEGEPEIIEEGMDDGYYVEDAGDAESEYEAFPDDLMPVD